MTPTLMGEGGKGAGDKWQPICSNELIFTKNIAVLSEDLKSSETWNSFRKGSGRLVTEIPSYLMNNFCKKSPEIL